MVSDVNRTRSDDSPGLTCPRYSPTPSVPSRRTSSSDALSSNAVATRGAPDDPDVDRSLAPGQFGEPSIAARPPRRELCRKSWI